MRLAGTGAEVAGIIVSGGWPQSNEEALSWQAELVIPNKEQVQRSMNARLLGM